MIGTNNTRSSIAGALLLGSLLMPAPRDATEAKIEDYVIDAEFYPEEGRIRATADISFIPGSVNEDTLVFFLHGELKVDRIEVGGRPVQAVQEVVFHENDYSNVAKRVKVPIPDGASTHSMRVVYAGYFNPSVVGALSNYMRIDRDGVFLRSVGYSIWFPVFVETWRDSYDVSFSKVTLRTPREFRPVFAGRHIRDYEEGGTRVSEWSASTLSLFDAQCTARRYDVQTDGSFHLYHMRDSVASRMAGEILSFSSRLKSLYQAHYRRGISADQTHVMQMPKYGNISSGNVIGIDDEIWSQFDETAWQSTTVAHELVHSFVRIPHSEEMGSFVIEGFPSYLHLPVMAEILGEQWYQDFMRSVARQYLAKRETGVSSRGEVLPPEKPILEIGTDEIGRYKDTFVLNDRVRLFFHFLRNQIGSEGFFRLTSDLLNQEMLDYDTIVSVIESHLPGSGNDIYRWLTTSDFPEEFQLKEER